ncbi:MAG TPA: 2Fe-2S ferredoxin [Gammaproteobacteria bacterium]|uniref:2Fe-2S iron-sulfur cluster-binding protein n=1 Tax=Immundisolibacter sp. TaxID=1934948 RepID=UPI000E7F91DD|nr:2Fe-2S ferredoxin [Gammaproteobacteria bacterium]HCZ47815.1 2Fe-2S ferredoxin [Gammaproteobacteria bacterium]MCH77253.1 2Fe-2S ferredoxin [Gammaproteobacteria bacterium]
MTTVIFVEADGTRHEVPARNGRSLMQAAVQNAVPGIDADCGGQCLCATCHVILDEAWYARLGDPNPDEQEMLAPTPERTPTSRLSCQIQVTDALDGLVVQLPAFQM